jgi:predicted RNA-binding Zn ribbon-like protein
MAGYSLPPLQVVPHRFAPADVCAGHVVLDFVNTAAGLNRNPRDWLASYDSLLDWAGVARVFDEDLLAGLTARNRSDPEGGRKALQGVRELRAALYTLVHHRRDATRPPATAVEVLQRWHRRAGASITLQPQDDGVLRPSLEACGLDAITASITLDAADLLSQPLKGAFGLCSGHNCGWIFLDASQTRRRRWCDMKTCGNAAKASRHYRRKREST